jgi:photosystem II stability/assembly factor-like uncharacterized protein
MSIRIRSLSAALSAALFAAACSSSTPQQELPDPRWKTRMRTEYSTGKHDDPEARDRWYWEQRAYPTGTIPVGVHRAAEMRELANRQALGAEAGWQSLGPAPLLDITYGLDTAQNSSGRALSLAIHPDNPDVLFLGTAQGGIWKSTDRGRSWSSVAEQSLPTLAINVIRFKPGNASVLFAATGEPNGSTSIHGTGLLRSTDGGATWEMLPPQGNGWDFEYSAVTGLEFDARNPETMYLTTATIVTASAFFKTPPQQPQTGFFKSTDGGQSWTRLRTANRYTVNGNPSPSAGFMDLEYGGAVAPDLLYASEFYGGLLKSEDGGATWSYITNRKLPGFGALPAPVASISSYDNQTRKYVRAGRFPNSETTPEFRRVEIGMSKSNPHVLYAGYEASTNRLDLDNNGVYEAGRDRTAAMGLMFKSEDGGATWRWLGSFLDGVPDWCTSQCTYDNIITVNPNDPNDVWIGGSANYSLTLPEPHTNPQRLVELPWRGMIYRSTNGGTSWVDTTPHCTAISNAPVRTDQLSGLPVYTCAAMDKTKVIHPDIHGIILGPQNQVYVVNDGGIYRTSTARPASPDAPSGRRRSASMRPYGPLTGLSYTWENLNDGLSTLQFYRVASHPTNPDIILGGMQDNSCGYWNGQTWEGWGAGDGTIAIFDPSDPNVVYLGSQFSVHRHDTGGVKDFGGWVWDVFPGISLVGDEQTAFVPVFALDPSQPNITYGASNRGIYRSMVRGESSNRLMPNTNTDGTPTSISVSPLDGKVVWVGTNTGSIYRLGINPGSGTASSMIKVDGANLPGRSVSRVVAGYDSANTVYAVFNGYDANTPGQPGKVFVSNDAGATWRSISGGLPDVPATALALHPHDVNRMWLSTDTAVYTTTDGGTSWHSERRNMPVVAVQDLHYNANTGYLVAATHGRGVWRLPVGAGAEAATK